MPNPVSLSDLATRMGFRGVPEVLEAAATPLERGHHLAMVASRGSGAESVYALAVLESCAPGDGLQALVLSPSRDRAEAVALAVQRAVGPEGLRAGVAPLRTDGSLDTRSAPGSCLAGRPSLLLPEVRLGRLGLADLKLLILDGVADLQDLDEWTSVEPLLDTLGTDVRRVAVTRRVDSPFRELLQRQLPRARKWPEEAFEEGASVPEEEGRFPRSLDVALGGAPPEGLASLVHAVEGAGGIRVRCRDESSMALVGAALESAGFSLGEPTGDWDVVGTRPGSDDDAADMRAWFGLPLSLESFADGPAGRAVTVVEPPHLPQLELLAARAGAELRFLPGPYPGAELNPLDRYRALVRARIERGGTDAELLVIEPLMREFGTTRVAAALSDLYRRSAAGASVPRPWADMEAASRRGDERGGGRDLKESGAGEETDRSHRGARGAWARVFIGAGNRDSVRAGDLVGAITGETGIAGAQIGKIDIKGSFSLVEIDSQVVDRVIEKLNGSLIRGREVVVKRDRGR